MKSKSLILFFLAIASLSVRADILFQDSTNYPYTNGPISGQGQWYTYDPSDATNFDVLVQNNNIILNTTNKDSVAAPTNGWVNDSETNFVSFEINVSQLPSSPNGSYFCQFQTTNNGVSVAHLVIDTLGTVVPNTYRLGIGNYATSFGGSYGVPRNLPLDLATGVTYTVVMAWDGDENSAFVGATLYVDPSANDGYLSEQGNVTGSNFIYPVDDVPSSAQLALPVSGPGAVSQVGFSPYVDASISNVVAANTFPEVNTTNLPVFGVQPLPGNYYSGNSETLYAVAAGSDITYQWYDSNGGGPLVDDGINYLGSTSNVLTVLNLTGTDGYYVVATDAYGNQVTSQTAVSTVNTTPTAPFFPSLAVLNLTNNLFLDSGFTNTALGTGPLNYQWYHEVLSLTNGTVLTPFAPLAGQTSPALTFNLADYSYNGLYYVQVSNAYGTTNGPTNSLVEVAPSIASLSQLHLLQLSLSNTLSSNPYLFTNNVSVSGYVTFNGGFGNTSYDEFTIQDTNGFAAAVYVKNPGNTSIDDSNTPPFGSYVTVQGEIQSYYGLVEIDAIGINSITVGPQATTPIAPKIANGIFQEIATNGANNAFDTNFIFSGGALLTFTNVYLYSSSTGGAIAPGATFPANGGTTSLYMFIGPYNSTNNTHYWTDYQRVPIYGGITPSSSQFAGKTIPSYCYQLTAVLIPYNLSSPEIIPSRLADYVTSAPASFPVALTTSKKATTLTWNAQQGSTYSILTSTNLSGPWSKAAYGLAYIPTNGSFIDTQTNAAKFYQLTTP